MEKYSTSLFKKKLLSILSYFTQTAKFQIIILTKSQNFKDIIKYWIEISQSEPITASTILSESLFFNFFIKIDNISVSPSFLKVKKNIFISDILIKMVTINLNQFREKFYINCSFFKKSFFRNLFHQHGSSSLKMHAQN